MSNSKQTFEAFKKGKQNAIEKVYLEYKNLMYFVISNYISNKYDCDDIFSDSFFKALTHKEEIKDYSKLKSFLCSIARNEAINFIRKNKEMPSSDLIDSIYGEEDHTNEVLNSLEPLLTNKETIVVYYKAVFGYSWEELTELTGISNSTARRLYDKAKEKLEKEFL